MNAGRHSLRLLAKIPAAPWRWFKALTLLNKLAVIGTAASVLGLLVAVLPTEPTKTKPQVNRRTEFTGDGNQYVEAGHVVMGDVVINEAAAQAAEARSTGGRPPCDTTVRIASKSIQMWSEAMRSQVHTGIPGNSLETAIEAIGAINETIDFSIDISALDEVGLSPEDPLPFSYEPAATRDILNSILDDYDSLCFVPVPMANGRVAASLTTVDASARTCYSASYQVSDITCGATGFSQGRLLDSIKTAIASDAGQLVNAIGFSADGSTLLVNAPWRIQDLVLLTVEEMRALAEAESESLTRQAYDLWLENEEQAAKLFRDSIALSPQSGDPYYWRASRKFDSGYFTGSASDTKNALNKERFLLRESAYMLMSMASQQAGELEVAERAANRAIESCIANESRPSEARSTICRSVYLWAAIVSHVKGNREDAIRKVKLAHQAHERFTKGIDWTTGLVVKSRMAMSYGNYKSASRYIEELVGALSNNRLKRRVEGRWTESLLLSDGAIDASSG